MFVVLNESWPRSQDNEGENTKSLMRRVVSNFSKERMDKSISRIRRRIVTVRPVGLCPYFPFTLHRQTYEIFMNRSGLSDGHFAMLMLAVGRIATCRP
jgi:hypothetical protein